MWRTTPAVLSTKVLPRMFRCPPATNSAIVRWGNLVPCGLGPFAVERLASVFDGCEGKANAVAPMNRPATGSVIPAVPGAPDTRQARLASAGRESALSAALRPRCVRAEKVVRDRGRVLRHHRTARHAGSRPDQCPDGAAGARA